MKPQPKISVVVTSYNHEQYIAQCLDSILMQRGAFELEVILGDDCSTDRTPLILQQYAEKNPGVFVLLPAAANMGVTRNIKRCLAACSGQYIAFCEGDDYWLDCYKLLKQSEFLESHPAYSLCFNGIVLHYESGNSYVLHYDQAALTKNTLTTEDLIESNFIGNFSCCMYRADVVRALPQALFTMCTWDWMFNMACSRLGKIGFIRDWMSVYRIRSHGAWSGRSSAEQRKMMVAAIDSYDAYFDHEYHEAFSRLKRRLAGGHWGEPASASPRLRRYLRLLMRAIAHPDLVRDRLRSSIAVAFGELTSAAVSTKIAELSSSVADLRSSDRAKDAQISELAAAVQMKDREIAELGSAVQTRDARLAELATAIFASADVAPAVPRKLHVGCGNVKLPGWLNIDIAPEADLTIDVRQGLLFQDNSVDFIYNEHFIEHLTYEEGEVVLKDFWRCLKIGGVLRIATPDLDFLIKMYDAGFRNEDWFPPGFEYVKTKGMAMNMAFKSWGHQYVYNEEELTIQLTGAGFRSTKRCEFGKSDYTELSNLETRKESTLVLEAVKD